MATLLLQTAGSALGSAFGAFGATLGGAVGALAGSAIDQVLFSPTRNFASAPLSGANIPSADEGAAIHRVYGTSRIAGDLIWSTRFEEEITTERQGGKSTGGGGTNIETRNYYANIALALCEGPITHIRRIWADGRELDTSQFEMRVYHGDENQLPDPLIEAKQGNGLAPPYRGIAYVVFEHMPLKNFGNRIPVLQFEVMRSIGQLEQQIEAVTLIPGATEHGLSNVTISENLGPGEQRFLNKNIKYAASDIDASLDELQALCPNLKSIGLVVSWFGTDLRAAHCQIKPGVEVDTRNGETRPWKVGSFNRITAHQISKIDGKSAYGGTPDDQSVVDAIRNIKARGWNVTLYPFLLMDIPSDNQLPAPNGNSSQPAYPWRGRITCDPDIGLSGTPDQTAQIQSHIDAFSGAASPTHFSISGDVVSWSQNDTKYRQMILHYAHLAQAAGGVDGFLIGTELVALNRLRDHNNNFPFVQKLTELAQDVRGVMGQNTKITYAADWSEYFGYHPQDGSSDVWFHLDSLWANQAIDAIGIDNYMPLSDWRDEDYNRQNIDGFDIQNDVAALQNQITGGEGFDWYYQSLSDRNNQIRTPITDGLGKPWVFRYKDLYNWWSNAHYHRIAGVEQSSATPFVPMQKPIWFTEIGCPAVDKGANQPNVFIDPKSAESFAPYYSNQIRDDLAQRAFLTAHYNQWSIENIAQKMVDLTHSYVWTWDARPYPAFPENRELWSDGENWAQGHWLNARLGNAPIGDLIKAILTDHGFENFDVSLVEGSLDGYVQGDVASARQMIEPLLSTFQIDVIEGEDKLIFVSNRKTSKPVLKVDNLVDDDKTERLTHQRVQDSELVNEMHLQYFEREVDYAPATAYSRRLSGQSSRQEKLGIAAVMDASRAKLLSDQWLLDHWASREAINFAVPINNIAFEVGDFISFEQIEGLDHPPRGKYLITSIEDGAARTISARWQISQIAYSAPSVRQTPQMDDSNNSFAPIAVYMDLPILTGTEQAKWSRVAAYSKPWVPMTFSASADQQGYVGRIVAPTPARIGYLTIPLEPGIEGRLDKQNIIEVDLPYGAFETISQNQLLAGGNLIAVKSNNDSFEMIQFKNAEEIENGRWRLSHLLRAQAGTDDAMLSGAAVGANFIFIDSAVMDLGLADHETGVALNWIAQAQNRVVHNAPTTSFIGGIRAVTPLSPVHLKAKRVSEGVYISWIRRARIHADSWLGNDIALDEDSEAYQIAILKDGNIVRSVYTTTSEYLYPSDSEIEDFSQSQAELTLKIYQIGSQNSVGIMRKETVVVQ